MKERIRRHGLKLGILVLSLVTLVLVAAVPGFAQSATSTTTPAAPSIHTIEGKVTAVAADKSSFTIQNGTQAPIIAGVDANTLYFMVPVAGFLGNIKGPVRGVTMMPPGLKDRVEGNNKSNAPSVKPAVIPPNWKNDLGFLSLFNRQAAFTDIQVGDRAIVRAQVSDNLAKQVLIIKAPVIQNIKGTISALSASSITITPATGAAVVLTWDSNTRFDLKGLIEVQVGQNAVATYNHNTMVAQIVNVIPPPPTPTPTATVTP